MGIASDVLGEIRDWPWEIRESWEDAPGWTTVLGVMMVFLFGGIFLVMGALLQYFLGLPDAGWITVVVGAASSVGLVIFLVFLSVVPDRWTRTIAWRILAVCWFALAGFLLVLDQMLTIGDAIGSRRAWLLIPGALIAVVFGITKSSWAALFSALGTLLFVVAVL